MAGSGGDVQVDAATARVTVAVGVLGLVAAIVVVLLTSGGPPAPDAAPQPTHPTGTATASSAPVTPDAAPGPAIDPELAGQLDAVRRRAERLAGRQTAPVTFRVGSFNVLGSQHTAAGGTRPSWPGWDTRAPGAVALLRHHQVDVVGLQELQPPQLAYLTRALGYAAYPGQELGERGARASILFDPSVWKRVAASTFVVPTPGAPRIAPVLLLEHRASGRHVYFVNMHPPAGSDARTTQARMAAYDRGVQVVNELKATGLPVVVTGDMNGRGTFFCRFLAPTGLTAAIGGSTTSGCQPPASMTVDWIAAASLTTPLTFSGYVKDGTPIARRISDHFLISAAVTVAGS